MAKKNRDEEVKQRPLYIVKKIWGKEKN